MNGENTDAISPSPVAASESELLTVIRALFDAPGSSRGDQAPGAVNELLRRPGRQTTAQISPVALGLVEDTMAKGLILALIRRGGWRDTEAVQDGEVVSGRLWQRHAPLSFHLSPFSFELCRWLTEQQLRSNQCGALDHAPVTLGDEFILYLAMDLAESARCAEPVAAQTAVRASALCWLGFADLMAGRTRSAQTPADISPYAFARWTSGAGIVVLEALQSDLARCWLAMERRKRRPSSAASLIARGLIQRAVLEAYFSALEQAGRRDLACFVIDAVVALLAERPDVDGWDPIIDSMSPLRERSEARRASLVLLKALGTVRQWVEQARGVRFFDDGYDAAQLLLRQWEAVGDSGYRRVTALLAELGSFEGLSEL